MNNIKDSLIPLNDIFDDNFQKVIFQNPKLKEYNKQTSEENEAKDNNIESFENSYIENFGVNRCPILYGDKINISSLANSNIFLSLDIKNDLVANRVSSYKPTLYFNSYTKKKGHYIKYGDIITIERKYYEKLKPSKYHCQSYINRYPDLQRAFGKDCDKSRRYGSINGPLDHWNRYGKREKRLVDSRLVIMPHRNSGKRRGDLVLYNDDILIYPYGGHEGQTLELQEGLPNKFKKLGCFRDTGNRALRYGPHRYGYNKYTGFNKIKNSYKYFALQNNGWLCADNDYRHATKYGRYNRCIYGANGDQGGPWANALYEVIKGEPRYPSKILSSKKNIGFKIKKPIGQTCNVRTPTMIESNDYSIKKVTIRCDDRFNLYIDGKKYSGNGWHNAYTFDKIKSNPKGSIIAVECFNGGGPGGLIAQIELNNGSFIVTDNTWEVAYNIQNKDTFLKNPMVYFYGSEWRKARINGPNQLRKSRWTLGNHPLLQVDDNFSPYANWIAGDLNRYGFSYFKKLIGRPQPINPKCRVNLTKPQALCYRDSNPEVLNEIKADLNPPVRYELNMKRMTWYQHEAEARRRGGHLASITSRDELNKLRKYWGRRDVWWGLWIGGRRKAHTYRRDGSGNSWAWTDGSSWRFSNWNRGEPNNTRENCLQLYKNGQWNDLPGHYRLAALYKIKIKSKYSNNVDQDLIYNLKRNWKLKGCLTREYKCAKPPDIVGNYEYKGCFSANYSKPEVIPNDRGNVSSLGECANLAEKNRDTVFGVKDQGRCFTGNDMKAVQKNGTTNVCPLLGKQYGFQVYKRKFPFDPLYPKLGPNNFQDNVDVKENFENKNNSNIYLYNYIILLILIITLIIIYFNL